MNVLKDRRGFTLIELLVTLVILGVVVGLTINTMNVNVKKTAEKTEEVFVDTLRDAIDMYVTTQLNSLNGLDSLEVSSVACNDLLEKTHGSVKIYEMKKNGGIDIKFDDIIGDNNNNVLVESEFVNPANEGKDDSEFKCKLSAKIKLYRDDDFVYYYYVDKNELGCLNNINDEYGMVISNLPLIDSDNDGVKDGYYTCS